MWRYYVKYLRKRADHTQAAAGAGSRVTQATISRWEDGSQEPEPAQVAALCRLYERSPLEGFVMAGMITKAEAGNEWTISSGAILRRLKDIQAAEKAAG